MRRENGKNWWTSSKLSKWVICVSLYKCQQKPKFKKKCWRAFKSCRNNRRVEGIRKSRNRLFVYHLTSQNQKKKKGKEKPNDMSFISPLVVVVFSPKAALFFISFFSWRIKANTVFDNLKRLGFLKCALFFSTFSGIKKNEERRLLGWKCLKLGLFNNRVEQKNRNTVSVVFKMRLEFIFSAQKENKTARFWLVITRTFFIVVNFQHL